MFYPVVWRYVRTLLAGQTLFRRRTRRTKATRSVPRRTTRTQAKASFIDPYVSGCIHVRTFSCSLGLGSITYTST